jgi:membrane associated rhomboid family serine protease
MLHVNQFRYGYLTPAVRGILLACAGVFVLQVILPGGLEIAFTELFGLSVPGMMNGWFWQVLTYGLLHGGIWHLLLNSLGLFFLGPELERHMGPRAFLLLFGFCVLLGGLGWLASMYPNVGVCIGASGGVFGLIGAYAGLFPHRQLTLLVFFVLPVTMPAWLLAVLFGLLQLAYLMNPGPSGIAYVAHLAGGLAGYLFVRVIYRERRVSGIPAGWRPDGWTRPPPPPDQPQPAEIDAILDKISTQGIHALSARERALLLRAGRSNR